MIDWTLASQIAQFVAGKPETVPLGRRLADASEESERLVTAYTRLSPDAPLPRAEAVSRPDWIEANLTSMRGLLDPVTERMLGESLGPLRGPLQVAAGYLLAAEVGVVVGYLSQRVLGQYEVVLIDPDSRARLLFVEPNIADGAKSMGAGVDPDDFLRWVALHETTHAVQFGGVPWLRDHLASLIHELSESLTVSVDPSKLARIPSADDLRGLVDAVRRGDLIGFATSPQQRELLDRVQATMAVVEGHAEHVMDAIGKEVIPGLDTLRASMERRRDTQPALGRLIARLIGLEMKMQQYKLGKSFCDGVVERGGIEALNLVWRDPESLPTLTELEDPGAWLRRVSQQPAAA
jgi:coenzyme F420 biosynthesis associated uncharacterized protein